MAPFAAFTRNVNAVTTALQQAEHVPENFRQSLWVTLYTMMSCQCTLQIQVKFGVIEQIQLKYKFNQKSTGFTIYLDIENHGLLRRSADCTWPCTNVMDI